METDFCGLCMFKRLRAYANFRRNISTANKVFKIFLTLLYISQESFRISWSSMWKLNSETWEHVTANQETCIFKHEDYTYKGCHSETVLWSMYGGTCIFSVVAITLAKSCDPATIEWWDGSLYVARWSAYPHCSLTVTCSFRTKIVTESIHKY